MLLNVQASSLQLVLMTALGCMFGGCSPDGAYIASPFWAQLMPSTVGPLIVTTVNGTVNVPFQSIRFSVPSWLVKYSLLPERNMPVTLLKSMFPPLKPAENVELLNTPLSGLKVR